MASKIIIKKYLPKITSSGISDLNVVNMLFYFYNFLLNKLNYAINNWKGLRRVSAPESGHKNGVGFFWCCLD